MNNIVATLATLRASSTFLTVRGYRSSESGELADYQVAFHMSYENALVASIAKVSAFVPSTEIEEQAKREVLASYAASLTKVRTEELPVEGEVYDRILNDEGTHVKGVKIHRESGKLHLFGLLVNKRVREAGTFKTTNKRPLTVAKDKLRKLGPVGKFRQFIIDPAHVEGLAVERMVLTPDE